MSLQGAWAGGVSPGPRFLAASGLPATVGQKVSQIVLNVPGLTFTFPTVANQPTLSFDSVRGLYYLANFVSVRITAPAHTWTVGWVGTSLTTGSAQFTSDGTTAVDRAMSGSVYDFVLSPSYNLYQSELNRLRDYLSYGNTNNWTPAMMTNQQPYFYLGGCEPNEASLFPSEVSLASTQFKGSIGVAVDKSRGITSRPKNRLLYVDILNNAANWVRSNINIAGSDSAGWTFTPTNGNGFVRQELGSVKAPGATLTFSVELKAGTGTSLSLGIQRGSAWTLPSKQQVVKLSGPGDVSVNPTTGEVTVTGLTTASWTRIAHTVQLSAKDTNFDTRIYFGSFNELTILVRRPQLEKGPVATDYLVGGTTSHSHAEGPKVLQATAASQPTLGSRVVGTLRNQVASSSTFNTGWTATNTTYSARGYPVLAVDGSITQTLASAITSASPVTATIFFEKEWAGTQFHLRAVIGGVISLLPVTVNTGGVASYTWPSVTNLTSIGFAHPGVAINPDAIELGIRGVQVELGSVTTAYQETHATLGTNEQGGKNVYYLYNDGGDSLPLVLPAGMYQVAWCDHQGVASSVLVVSDGTTPTELLRATRVSDLIVVRNGLRHSDWEALKRSWIKFYGV